jgi:hypothetical protein
MFLAPNVRWGRGEKLDSYPYTRVKGPYIQRGLLCEAGARVMKCHQYFWVHA